MNQFHKIRIEILLTFNAPVNVTPEEEINVALTNATSVMSWRCINVDTTLHY